MDASTTTSSFHNRAQLHLHSAVVSARWVLNGRLWEGLFFIHSQFLPQLISAWRCAGTEHLPRGVGTASLLLSASLQGQKLTIACGLLTITALE
jgi:hypothetical protein